MQILENVDIQNKICFRTRTHTRWYTETQSTDDLLAALEFADKRQCPWLILGEGSNILFIDNFEGLLIHHRRQGIQYFKHNHSTIDLRIEAGHRWHDVVVYAVNHNLWGIENLALIPGTVGAAPIQNIGAYGVELSDTLQQVEVYDTRTETFRTLSNADCQFDYRTSIFKRYPHRWIIQAITLRLSTIPMPQLSYPDLAPLRYRHNLTVAEIVDTIIRIRQQKLPDPRRYPNAGSFFKNPIIPRQQWENLRDTFPNLPGFEVSKQQIKIPAAWLIERTGWKGRRQGNVGVSDRHALVLVNYGNATGREILSLAYAIQQSVYETFTILLEPEVRILNMQGAFLSAHTLASVL